MTPVRSTEDAFRRFPQRREASAPGYIQQRLRVRPTQPRLVVWNERGSLVASRRRPAARAPLRSITEVSGSRRSSHETSLTVKVVGCLGGDVRPVRLVLGLAAG
jgi:hypothetical protein